MTNSTTDNEWNQEEFLKEFDKKFENGTLEEEVFDFLDNDYLPKIFGDLNGKEN